MESYLRLSTARLVLRKLEPRDWEMVSYLRSDKDINKYVNRPSAETQELALQFIKKTNDGIKKNTFCYWAITQPAVDVMIGSICLWNFSEDRKKAELGYDLSPSFQGQGIMHEALAKVVDLGFNTLMLDVIEAFTHRLNAASIKLLERNGFVLMEDRLDEDNLDNAIYELNNRNN